MSYIYKKRRVGPYLGPEDMKKPKAKKGHKEVKSRTSYTTEEFFEALISSIATWTEAEKAHARMTLRKAYRKPLKDRLYREEKHAN